MKSNQMQVNNNVMFFIFLTKCKKLKKSAKVVENSKFLYYLHNVKNQLKLLKLRHETQTLI